MLDEGRYELRLTINDETKEDWFLRSPVRNAAAQPENRPTGKAEAGTLRHGEAGLSGRRTGVRTHRREAPYPNPTAESKAFAVSKPTRPRSQVSTRRTPRKRPASAPSTRRWSYVRRQVPSFRQIARITSSPSSSWTTQGRFTTA